MHLFGTVYPPTFLSRFSLRRKAGKIQVGKKRERRVDSRLCRLHAYHVFSIVPDHVKNRPQKHVHGLQFARLGDCFNAVSRARHIAGNDWK
jgi:hypothetical protein